MAIQAAPYKQCPERADYSLALRSGALTLVAADAPVWSMQWTSTSLICVVKRIKISVGVTTAYTTAQVTRYGLYFARAFTVADTGGAAATLTTNNGKKDTSYPITAIADMRMSTTGAITAGTRTLDAQPLDIAQFSTSALSNADDEEWNYGMVISRQELIIRQNEGLVINNLTLMGAVGVLLLAVTLEWAEVPLSSVK
jgi:hypothetical protein